MKQLAIAAAVVLFAGCKDSDQKSFTVEGKIKGDSAKTIYLEETALGGNGPLIVDSANLDGEGKFKLSTLSKEETIYNLRLAGQNMPVVSLINDAEEVAVDVDPASKEVYSVKGSEASEALRSYLFETGSRMRQLYADATAVDSMRQNATADSIVNLRLAERSVAVTGLKNYTSDFVGKTKSPALAMFALGSYQSMASNPVFGLESFTEADLKTMVQKAAAQSPDHLGLGQLNKSLQAQPQAAPASLLNKPAPAFSLPAPDGKAISLASFKGKWVLVDFWASWCKPCRQENPNVVAAYNQFKNKNFTVFGVSLDQKKDAWQEAIAADGLAWPHVSDLKFWNSAVVPLYGIEGIPYNVLVNPDGVIVAEGLRGNDLVQKLNEVL